MTERQTLYTGLSRAAWGCFFLYFNLNLGPVNLLPNFVGYLLILSAIRLLEQEQRDLRLLRPLGVFLALYTAANAAVTLLGGEIKGSLLTLLVQVAQLYFLFQLFTDCAAIAARYQGEGDRLDRRLLFWRKWQTICLTAAYILVYLPRFAWMQTAALCAAAVSLFAGFWAMRAIFSLRKLFREEEAHSAPPGIDASDET